MTLWVVFAVMGVLATVFVAWPLYRRQQRLTAVASVSILAIVGVAAGLYAVQGTPSLPSVAQQQADLPDVGDMVLSLAERLEQQPEDLQGWKMLGRSYMSLQNFAGAVAAFERAVALERPASAQTQVELGEALLAANQGSRIEGRIAALFDSALALEPNNPTALFYGGIGALNRGDQALAADRWELLLGLNPPDEIQGVLRQRIAEWRGEAVPAAAPTAAPRQEQSGAVVTAAISVSAEAAAALPADATVFVIARDPAAPAPPIAVTRRRLAELPDTIQLRDGDSMIPGRTLSGFPEFELVARVSLSGQPVQQPGDWFGSRIVKPAESAEVALSIDQQVR